MNRTQRFCILSVIMGLSGCVTMGKSFNTQMVPTIVVGKTTQADVKRTFGEPYRTGIESGDTTWTYLNYHFNVFTDQRTTDLYVRFNSDKTVKSYAFNTNVPADQVTPH